MLEDEGRVAVQDISFPVPEAMLLHCIQSVGEVMELNATVPLFFVLMERELIVIPVKPPPASTLRIIRVRACLNEKFTLPSLAVLLGAGFANKRSVWSASAVGTA